MTLKRQSRFGDIAAAFLLLSRIPITYQFAKDSPPDFISSLWAFPIVGLVIGGFGGMMLAFASFLGLPLLVCGGVSVGVMAMASGAMHEDGLADTADGFGGGKNVDDKMRIMHNSHIGSYGVLALCISTIIRISLFASIAGLDLSNLALIGLVAAIAAAARWQILIALWAFPIAAGAKLAKVTGRPSVVVIFAAAFLWMAPLAYFALPIATVIAGIAALFACLGLGRIAMRQINGISGDVMGAMIILAEIMLAAGLCLTVNISLDIGFFG
ncbi:adenosylcobinamide-GDP ribazoletransferase [Candidatus Puniceispirillum sp.]|nr:adenosylcobinamide-GDP ribazoletransferase [Candidatus Puniceispirillum sp.]